MLPHMWSSTQVTSRRSFEEAVDRISFAITVGDLQVGDRIPSERTLAEEMGVSRPTIREAIRVLVEAGVVSVTPGPGGGMHVASDDVPATMVADNVALTVSEVAWVLEARRLFEPRVAQMAGIVGTEPDFRRMRETIDLQRQAVGDRNRTNQLDERFHIRLARATGNPTIVEMMRGLLGQLAIAWDMDYRQPTDPERGIAAHERTLKAIMSRDPAEIDAAMDEHLSILERLWEDETGRPRLRHAP